ncbi:hypothetical protein ACFL1P_01125 [Patescibacteria group bacterium]
MIIKYLLAAIVSIIITVIYSVVYIKANWDEYIKRGYTIALNRKQYREGKKFANKNMIRMFGMDLQKVLSTGTVIGLGISTLFDTNITIVFCITMFFVSSFLTISFDIYLRLRKRKII